MADIKISELSVAATPLTGAELLELSQLSGGVYGSVQATAEDVAYANVRLGSFYDTNNQTGSISGETSVRFGTNDIANQGVTVVTDGSALTRITYSDGGVYMVAPSLQFANSDSSDHDVTVWFKRNANALAASATKLTVPKASDGGAAFFQIVYYVTLNAGDYVQVSWLPENAAVTLAYAAAGAIAPAVPSAIVVTERIAL
jgi:hypothetical protein